MTRKLTGGGANGIETQRQGERHRSSLGTERSPATSAPGAPGRRRADAQHPGFDLSRGCREETCRHADIASAPRPRLCCRVRRFSSSSPHLPASTPLLISSSPFRIAATCAWIWLKELRCVNLGVSGVGACCQRLSESVSQSVSQASQSVESSQHRSPVDPRDATGDPKPGPNVGDRLRDTLRR